MELFGSDRDRLAFLVEIDAALDLDFEALEVQALEEPAQLHQLEAEAGRLDLEAHTRVGCRRPIRFLRLGGRGLHVREQGDRGRGQRPAALLPIPTRKQGRPTQVASLLE